MVDGCCQKWMALQQNWLKPSLIDPETREEFEA